MRRPLGVRRVCYIKIMATIRELERGIWLDDSVPEDTRHEVEGLCHLLARAVGDLVVSLSLYEHARAEQHRTMHEHRTMHAGSAFNQQQWQRDAERTRTREAELEAAAGLSWGAPDYFEKSEQIREQVRRELLREKWQREGGPEQYRRRLVFIHARSFVSTLAVLQRALITLCDYDFEPEVTEQLVRARDAFAAALPGLKDVRDSTAHAEDRVRGRERGGRKIALQPLSNQMIHAPGGGVLVIESLNNDHFGGTIADGTYAEVEVADATTEIARAAVQAVFDALPWRPGHRLHEPSL